MGSTPALSGPKGATKDEKTDGAQKGDSCSLLNQNQTQHKTCFGYTITRTICVYKYRYISIYAQICTEINMYVNITILDIGNVSFAKTRSTKQLQPLA